MNNAYHLSCNHFVRFTWRMNLNQGAVIWQITAPCLNFTFSTWIRNFEELLVKLRYIKGNKSTIITFGYGFKEISWIFMENFQDITTLPWAKVTTRPRLNDKDSPLPRVFLHPRSLFDTSGILRRLNKVWVHFFTPIFSTKLYTQS